MKHTRILWLLPVIALLALWTGAQTASTVSAPPALTPLDPTPIAAALAQNSSWTNWAQTSIAALGGNQFTDEQKIATLTSQVQALQAQVAALQANPGPVTTQPQPVSFYVGDPKVCTSAPAINTQNTANSLGVYQVVGYIQTGQTFTCKVTLSVAGNYQFSVQASTAYSGMSLSWIVNGVVTTAPVLGNGWGSYATVLGPTVALAAGQPTFQLIASTGSVNLGLVTMTPR